MRISSFSFYKLSVKIATSSLPLAVELAGTAFTFNKRCLSFYIAFFSSSRCAASSAAYLFCAYLTSSNCASSSFASAANSALVASTLAFSALTLAISLSRSLICLVCNSYIVASGFAILNFYLSSLAPWVFRRRSTCSLISNSDKNRI